jgi:capsular polysaccharide biosynthesis protein
VTEVLAEPAASDAPHRSSPLAALRHYWPVTVVLLFVGLLGGIGYGHSRPVTYNAESRVAVGTGSLSAEAVAGYTTGVDAIAADYAHAVTTQDEITALRKTIGSGPNGADGVSAVNASPLPDSAVIRVDVAASSAALAVKATNAVTASFIAGINATITTTTPATLLSKYNAVSSQLVPAQTAQAAAQTALGRLEGDGATAAEVTAAQQKLDALTVTVNDLTTQATALQSAYQTAVGTPTAENGLRSVQSAALIGSNSHSLLERWALIGLVVGAILALAGAFGLDYRRVQAGRAVLALPAEDGVGAKPLVAGTRLVHVHDRSDQEPAVPDVEPAAPMAADPYLREAQRVADQDARDLDAAEARQRDRRATGVGRGAASDPLAPADTAHVPAAGFFAAADGTEVPPIEFAPTALGAAGVDDLDDQEMASVRQLFGSRHRSLRMGTSDADANGEDLDASLNNDLDSGLGRDVGAASSEPSPTDGFPAAVHAAPDAGTDTATDPGAELGTDPGIDTPAQTATEPMAATVTETVNEPMTEPMRETAPQVIAATGTHGLLPMTAADAPGPGAGRPDDAVARGRGWPDGYGLHAPQGAVNAGAVTGDAGPQ